MNWKRTVLLFSTLLTACASSPATVAQVPQRQPRARPAARRSIPPERLWLTRDCSIGESKTDSPRLREQIRKRGLQVEDFFLTALRDGPDEQRMRAIESYAKISFERYRRGIARKYVKPCLTPELYKQASSVLEEAYKIDVLKCYLLAYQARAIWGLVVIKSPKAVPELRAIMDQDEHPLRSTAERALRELG